MKADTLKLLMMHLTTLVLLGLAGYAFFVNRYEVPDLVAGALIGWVTLALNSIYADNASTRTARQSQAAYDKGLGTPTPGTTTVTSTTTPEDSTTAAGSG